MELATRYRKRSEYRSDQWGRRIDPLQDQVRCMHPKSPQKRETAIPYFTEGCWKIIPTTLLKSMSFGHFCEIKYLARIFKRRNLATGKSYASIWLIWEKQVEHANSQQLSNWLWSKLHVDYDNAQVFFVIVDASGESPKVFIVEKTNTIIIYSLWLNISSKYFISTFAWTASRLKGECSRERILGGCLLHYGVA